MNSKSLTRVASKGKLSVVATAMLAFTVSTTWGASYTITDLGTLPGGSYSSGMSINDKGQVVGEASTASAAYRAFLWSEGAMTELYPSSPGYSGGYSINNNGLACGYIMTPYAEHAAIFDGNTVTDLGTMGYWRSTAQVINDQGHVTGGCGDMNRTVGHAFFYDGQTTQAIGTFGGARSAAFGMNNRDQVTGWAMDANGVGYAFIWSPNGTMTKIDGPLTQGQGLAINDQGHVLVYGLAADGSPHSYIYARGTLTDLGLPQGYGGLCGYGLNERDQVVGDGQWPSAGLPALRPYLYSDGTLSDLNDLIPPGSGWTLEHADDINESGQIVGYGQIGGETHAYRLEPQDVAGDTTPPVIQCPAGMTAPCSVDRLVPVVFTVTATDNIDPSPTVTCLPPSGSGFPIGRAVVNCTASDASGNQSSCSFTVTRAPLGFAGFLSPIGGSDATGGSFSSPVCTFKMGSTVPVKFTASCTGSSVLTGIHTLQAVKYNNSTTAAAPIDATPQDAESTGNQFRLTGCQWHFNLDTKATGMSSGIWQLIANLSDGSQHKAWIQLK